MYQIGQQVLYGIHGVCTIASIEPMRFGKSRSDYYILQPLAQADSKYYIPVNNEAAVSKLSPLLTREEVLALLHSQAVRQDVWVADENQRKLKFREILTGGDRGQVLSMIYCLHRHKQEQQSLGRKFHQCDELFLKDAEKLMNGEFSHILGLEPNQVAPFILKEIDQSGEGTAQSV